MKRKHEALLSKYKWAQLNIPHHNA